MTGSPFDVSGRILVNVQAATQDSAVAATERFGDQVLIGVTARDFPVLADGVTHIAALSAAGVAVSAGLGDGAADQWERALEMALRTAPAHLNQVFPAAALSQRALASAGAATKVNALVRPSGQPGKVIVTTGPRSHTSDGALSIDAALDMLVEVGVGSVKAFPIEGVARLDELAAIARAAAERDMMLEPTGGITPDSLPAVLEVCLDAGVTRLMPHLYGSVKDPATADLSLARLDKVMSAIDHCAKRMSR